MYPVPAGSTAIAVSSALPGTVKIPFAETVPFKVEALLNVRTRPVPSTTYIRSPESTYTSQMAAPAKSPLLMMRVGVALVLFNALALAKTRTFPVPKLAI